MKKFDMTTTVTMKSGKYYLCDNCYVVPDRFWNSFCEQHINKTNDGLIDIEGKICLAFQTKYGDGGYVDNQGNEYGVDAGIIGLTPVELCEEESTERIVDFPEDFICTHNPETGTMTFGEIRIETGMRSDYDESYSPYHDESSFDEYLEDEE